MDDSDDALAVALNTLGSPVRLRMLRQLRSPKALREIEVAADRSVGGRTASRQTVREHLDRLMEAGMVTRRPAQRPYGETQEFTLNHAAIFALGEEARGLARMRATIEPSIDTAPLASEEVPQPAGPRLVVVKGLDEGAAFDLRPNERSEWVVGRRRGLAVSLDFDPYVSTENSVIRWSGDAHVLSDLPDSRNGTFVNFRRLAPDAQWRLRHGDVVGVGRSMLVYWS